MNGWRCQHLHLDCECCDAIYIWLNHHSHTTTTTTEKTLQPPVGELMEAIAKVSQSDWSMRNFSWPRNGMQINFLCLHFIQLKNFAERSRSMDYISLSTKHVSCWCDFLSLLLASRRDWTTCCGRLDDTKRHIEKIISMLNVTSMESMDLNRKVIHENNEKFYDTNNNRGMTQTEYYINQTHWKTLTLVCFRKSGSQLV